MKLSEVATILETRIGWDNDKTIDGFVLDAHNQTTDSGMFFQSEHTAITLETIRYCQPRPNISDADFNEYLTKLRMQAVRQVLDDAFEKDYVKDNLLTLFPNGFDSAIKLRMVIVFGEIVMTSSRSNRIERTTKELAAKMHYDLYRDTVQKFANNNSNYRYAMGIAARYSAEITEVERRFGTRSGLLKTITKGQAYRR